MKNIRNQLIPILVLLALTNVSLAQAPNLGSAVNFVLFTSIGAVGNTGISQLTGDIGTNNGAITGFGNVNGVMHNSDGATATAAADVLSAYNQLNATIPGFFPAPLLGNGQTLNAGVYSISGNSTLNLALNLDAQGDSNAVFIFLIQGTFSENALAQVNLVNGALACRVFWKVEGLVSLAPGSTMRGTVIAHNAAIDLNSGVTLEGRALSTTGAINTNNVLAYTPIGCGSTFLTGPVAPVLGTVACYALFSAVGPVTNAGVSFVGGDIGSNTALTSGFNPLFVSGAIHPVPDGSTAAVAANLGNVATYLNALPYDIELLYPAQFGNSLVLTPHTYRMSAAAALTDTVFLNAQNNANATFVIQIMGALTTSTFAQVVLLNGAQPQNVYWIVNGAITINNFSNFVGTVISNNGAVDLNTGANINGRVLTTNGAFNTAAINTTMIGCSGAALPVTWLYFRGKPVMGNIELEWGTGYEGKNDFFTIERSNDAVLFSTLTIVNASEENGKAEHHYSFVDQQACNNCYYRLSQHDVDGKPSIYRTIMVNTTGAMQITSYIKDHYSYLQINDGLTGDALITIYDLSGRQLSSEKIMIGNGSSTYRLKTKLLAGMYILHLQSQGKIMYTAKVVSE